MKQQIRVLGIDDSPFTFNDKSVTIIGIVMRPLNYIDAVIKSKVERDGTDSNIQLEEMINNSKYKEQLRVIMLDGIALAGFNVVDIEKLNKNTKLPVLTITRDKPNFESMKRALKLNFNDWEKRWKIIQKGELFEIETKHKPIYVKFTGIDLREVKEVIKLTTVRGALPEPIRVAHLVASAFVKGESYGRA